MATMPKMDFTQELHTLETAHTQHRADGAFDQAAQVREQQVELFIARHLLRPAVDYSVGAGNDWMHHARMLRRSWRMQEADDARQQAITAYVLAIELELTPPPPPAPR